jgi:hypothetical protein
VADYNYTVYFEPLEEGGYQVIVPAIPEICTFGDTLKKPERWRKTRSGVSSKVRSMKATRFLGTLIRRKSWLR